ncbi:MAG: right-handed parallel beta-helix repeat-containing protein [Desulfobulbaceae bacterium]|nr:right-handed parallel beta-helix repeat-containing protein [Desulfobulbaceae bacterium]
MRSKTQLFLSLAVFLVYFFCAIQPLRAENFAGYERTGSIAVDEPVSVALDEDENLYVVQTGNNRIQVYDNSLVLQGTLAGLDAPKSIAVGEDGRIYVGNGKNGNRKNVEVYDQDFTLLFKLGDGDGEFVDPASIAVDNRENGKIYVIDSNMLVVKMYEKDGSFLDSFNGSDSVDGSFVYPVSLTVDENTDELIVIDFYSSSNRVQVFDLEGNFVSSFGGAGQLLGEGQLPRPIGVDIDRDSNIFIVDSYQEPVQVFSSAGNFLGTVWDPDHRMLTNMEIAIGRASDRLFIASQGRNSVEIYTIFEEHTVFASAGTGGSISPAGEITVTNGENLTFTITPDPGNFVSALLVDGQNVEPSEEYAFINILGDHVIEAEFSAITYNISATSGYHGDISPAGIVPVNDGGSQTFTFTADEGYYVYGVIVDGVLYTEPSVAAGYTLENVTSDHEIQVSFCALATPGKHTVHAGAGPGGSISPAGEILVDHGESLIFTITPDAGNFVSALLVDGENVEPAEEYELINIAGDHVIEAEFSAITHTISTTAGQHGTISPSGKITVKEGDSQAFTFTPDEYYYVSEVIVDGVPQPASSGATGYTFENVTSSHEIQVNFATNFVIYNISVLTVGNGSISPDGILYIKAGETKTFYITPDAGYQIEYVLVDNVSQGAVSQYTFEDLSGDHSIWAKFSETINYYTITPTAADHGTIAPANASLVGAGEDKQYFISPNDGYYIDRVLVDNVSIGSQSTYVFTDVSADHSIHADFSPRDGDKDLDGMPNGWEYDHGLNPSLYDAFDDKDGDGYCNLREYLGGTQPDNCADTPAPGEIYVDIGNSSGTIDGSAVHPFNTIQTGILVAADNDTVLVAPGTYQENISIDKSISLIGHRAENTIIDASTATSSAVHCRNMSHGEISGFSISGGTSAGILCDNSIVDIRNNIISNTIALQDTDGHGVAGDSNSSLIIENNVISRNDHDGIHLFAGVSAAIYNNTCVFNGRDGIALADGEGVVIKNNVVAVNGNNGITSTGTTEPTAAFNNVWSNSVYDYVGFTADGLSIDPLFTDAANGDYHLRSSSPNIDAGTSDGAPDQDFEGNDRVDDPNVEPNKGGGLYNYYDIGAFEYIPKICDLDGDGWVDGLDLAIFARQLADMTNTVGPKEFAAAFGR